MARRNPKSMLGVFGSIKAEHITAQGVGTFSSAFTQGGAGPGSPIPADALSRWRPTLIGAQTQAISLAAVRGGFPGIDGQRVVYRLATDTGERDYRGWSEPNLPTQWSAATNGWGTAVTFTRPAATAIPKGKVAVISPLVGSTTTGSSWTYSARTEVWTPTFDWSTGPGLEDPTALAYDAGTGRLIAWTGSGLAGTPTTRAYSSVDEGVTWTLYSRGMWPVDVVAGDRVRVAADPDGGADWLAIVDVFHCVSSDRGVTWRQVSDLTADISSAGALPIRTRAGWLIAYIDPATDSPTVRLLAAPSATFLASTAVVVDTRNAGDIVGCTDDDGVVYLLCRGTAGDTARHIYTMYRSVTAGRTWEIYAWHPQIGNDARSLSLMDLVATNGQLHLLYSQGAGASADVDGTVAILTLGGWGQLESGSGIVEHGAGQKGRFSYGHAVIVGGTPAGQVWFPYTVPEGMGWTRTTGTGTRAINVAAIPGLKLTTTAGQGELYAYYGNVSASALYTCGEVIVQTDATSSTLATIGTGNPGPVIRPRLGNIAGTLQYEPYINVGTDGISVTDGLSTLATALFDTRDNPVHIRWMLRHARITVWYRKEGALTTVWTRVANDVLLPDIGGVTTAGVEWGNGVGAAGVATWRLAGGASAAEWLNGIDSAAESRLTSEDGVRGLRWGHVVPGSGAGGYPIPDATGTPLELGRLVATGGPALDGEIVELPVAYAEGIHHLDPERSPSPRARWKATFDAQQTVVYDRTDPTWDGGAFAIVAINVTTPTITVSFDDGAGAFAAGTALSMALISSWNYTLAGRVLIPRAGTTVLDRYVSAGELIGAWCICSTAGTPEFRRITDNSAGFWTTDAAFQQIRITLAAAGEEGGVDGTEVAAGTGTLYHHSAVMVVYPTGDTPRRYVRIQVAAVTGGGIPSGGIVDIAQLVGLGTDPDMTWSRTLEFARTLSRSGDGTPSVRRAGPPRTIWSYPYTGGVDLQAVRTIAQGSAHVAASGGMPIGTVGDGWLSWFAHIEHGLRSGEAPCLFLPAAPTTTSVIFDPTLYVYGLLAAESISVQSVVGREGVDEWVRMDAPTIEQIR